MNINNTFADINNRLSLVENNQKELNQYILSLQNEIEFLKSQIVSMNETFNNTFTLLLNQTTKVNIKKKDNDSSSDSDSSSSSNPDSSRHHTNNHIRNIKTTTTTKKKSSRINRRII
jgi:hypothetical protein